MKLFNLKILLIVFILLISSTLAAGADFEGLFKTYPLPIKVEGDIIPSKCYLSLKVYDYNQPSSIIFAHFKNKSPELTLKNIILSIQQNNLQAFRDMSETEGDVKSVFKMYRT